jgi:hypothetical protein
LPFCIVLLLGMSLLYCIRPSLGTLRGVLAVAVVTAILVWDKSYIQPKKL